MTSDSTRDTVSGKGLNECRSAMEQGVCPVCADEREKTHVKFALQILTLEAVCLLLLCTQ